MNRIFFYILSLAALITACGSTTVESSADNATPPDTVISINDIANSPEAKAWVDSVFASMSSLQRIGQLFVPVVDPTNHTAAKTTLRNYVATNSVGGLLFSKGSLNDYATLFNYAQSLAKTPLLITLDGEWGLSMRIPDSPRFPYSMSLGAISNDQLLYDYGMEVARECRRLGIHVNFAPVLDVNSNPDNPVIGYRSFGENPERVANAAISYSMGLEDGGVMSVGKHFPGHGDTSSDSHKTLPTLTHSFSRLDSVDLYPFKQYIAADLAGVMVGHLCVPAIDASGVPASLSHKITTDLLRNHLGFNGLLFTDALAMQGAKSNGNNCVDALKAGADILLSPAAVKSDIAAVVAAVKSGDIPQSVIDEKCRKILAYKYALGLNNYQPIELNGLESDINSPEAEAINRRLHAAMMTCISNRDNLLPIGGLDTCSVAVVSIGESKDNTFSRYCSKYVPIDTYSSHGTAFSETTLASIKKHDIIIVGLFDDKASSRSAYAQLSDSKNIVPVFFMNPYKMGKYTASISNTATLMIAYEKTELAREYAAQALFGGIAVDGRLPVDVKGVAKEGVGVSLPKTRLGYTSPAEAGFTADLTTRLDSLIKTGLTNKAFPGCQLLVAKDGKVVVDKVYGKTDYISNRKVTESTIYDLASVSKATGMLPGIMEAFDRGLFTLDSPISEYLDALKDTDKESITVRDLLYHESGLPASINIYALMVDSTSYSGKLFRARPNDVYSIKLWHKTYINRNARLRRDITSATKSNDYPHQVAHGQYVSDAASDTIIQKIYSTPLRSKTYRYSDLNFCLLMELEEKLTGIDHDKWVEQEVFAPLGARHTLYRPLSRYKSSEIAPTEKDKFLRKQLMQGYVHDETAAMSGGVQGNAGLFSTAGDLAKLCQMWLNGGTYGENTLLSPETVALFLKDKSPNSRRGLGFDKPDMENPDKSPTATEASAATIGHIGFTGTCFWVDPDNGLIYIFLCNRINPTRDNSAFSELNIRPKLFSIIYQSLR